MKKKNKLTRARRNGKLRPKDEAFCQAVAAGVSATRAYKDEISEAQCTTSTAQTAAWRMLQRSEISSRIAELRERDKRTIEEKLGFGREQLARYYVDAITTPVGEVDEHHPLCQEYTVTAGEEFSQTKVKMVGKMDAARELAKMAGWMPQSGGSQGVPQVVINLGAMYSPALQAPEGPERSLRILHPAEVRLGD